MIALETRRLTKRFGALTAVNDLSLEIRAGEIFGFLGPNGAGKTTSIQMMCGLLRPDSESGALKRLRLTRLTAFDYLGGTSLWLALVSVLAVLLTFGTAVVFGFRSQGPLGFLMVILTSFSIIGIGLIVACFSKTVSQAFVIANFPLGFLMFLTGAAFPLPRFNLFTLFGHNFALPGLLPPTHAVVALNKIFTLGASLGEVTFELAALVVPKDADAIEGGGVLCCNLFMHHPGLFRVNGGARPFCCRGIRETAG